MTATALYKTRIALLQTWLQDNNYDGILLSRVDNYAMATGGKQNYINTYGDIGANSFFVSRDGKGYFVGNKIEAPRQQAEELAELDCDHLVHNWFESSPAEIVSKHFSGNLVSDDGTLGPNVNGQLAGLRSLLTPAELEKYRHLGALTAHAMTETIQNIQAGMTEADIAAQLVHEGRKRQCHVPVALVAADDRIAQFRHPLPTVAPLVAGHLTEKTVQNYVMVVGCFMREGLVVSLTRFAQVDTLPDGISDAMNRIAAVDTEMMEASRPGRTLGDVFEVCTNAYTRYGFPQDEWHNHHQGGPTGYAGRTDRGRPCNPFPVLDTLYDTKVSNILGESTQFSAAFAWNPSAVGVKSEDTFILLPDGSQEIITPTPKLPTIDLPAVLGRDTTVIKAGIYLG